MGSAMLSAIFGFLILAVIVMVLFQVTFWVAVGIIAVTIVVFVILTILLSQVSRKRRRNELLQKYGDQNIVERIMSGDVWQGMTRDQLVDCLGQPLAIDQKVDGHKLTEICKYKRDGTNRFRLRVSVRDGVVVGWQQRGD